MWLATRHLKGESRLVPKICFFCIPKNKFSYNYTTFARRKELLIGFFLHRDLAKYFDGVLSDLLQHTWRCHKCHKFVTNVSQIGEKLKIRYIDLENAPKSNLQCSWSPWWCFWVARHGVTNFVIRLWQFVTRLWQFVTDSWQMCD